MDHPDLATTHDPLFDSAWLKWTQAMVHCQTLERDVEVRTANGDLDPVRAFRAQYNPKRHGFAVIVEDLAPVPVRWQLLLGDIANNYRAALDHLAWALVSRGRTPPGVLNSRQEKAVYFPICEDRNVFNAEIRVPATAKSRLKLPGIRRTDSAKVRRCQPYHRSARTRERNSLVILSGINTGDKHRTVQPLWAFPTRVDMEVTHMRDCVLRGEGHVRRYANPLENGTEVAFMQARKLGNNPELEMKLKLTTRPTIDNRISVRDWHVITGIAIFNLLRMFSPQPASIHEVGAELVRWDR